MNRPIHRQALLAALALAVPLQAQDAGPLSLPAPQPLPMQFDVSAPYGAAAELRRHLGTRVDPPQYDLGQETFHVLVPETYSTNGAWGLLVWISPGDDPRVPTAWTAELARQQLLFVSAVNAGNSRDALQRCRLALDATCNMCRRFKIDPQRLFIAGFSGGGRIASILGVAYADLFSGTLAICGADFYQSVRAPTGEVFPATYRPDPRVLLRAKTHGRFVLLTGQYDANRLNTKTLAELGFQAQGFQSVRYLEVASMKHTLPSPAVLSSALELLERNGGR